MALLPGLLLKADQVLIKASPMIDIKEGLRSLPNVKRVYVWSLRNECKEVLFWVIPGTESATEIHCVNQKEFEAERFVFNYDQESSLSLEYDDPGNYILIPNAAVLKAGAFRTIASSFPTRKIAPNTHLYTADVENKGFPGRQFEVLRTGSFKALTGKIPSKVNLISRNHPLRSEAIARKLKVQEGGDDYVIAFRDQRQLLVNRQTFIKCHIKSCDPFIKNILMKSREACCPDPRLLIHIKDKFLCPAQ
jgi:hypothetical protein